MQNLEELKKKYEELGKEIERLEKQKENKRWRATNDTRYFILDSWGRIISVTDALDPSDEFRYKIRNYFKAYEEAQRYLDNLNTYYDLMDLAEELNNGEKVNWNDMIQSKYYIYYNFNTDKLQQTSMSYIKNVGQIYSLNENFLDIALKRIGKERLEKLFKEDK